MGILTEDATSGGVLQLLELSISMVVSVGLWESRESQVIEDNRKERKQR